MQENNKFFKFLRAMWEYIKEAKMELIVLAVVIIVDLVSKSLVDANMDEGQCITLIPNFLNITYIHNDKAAFGSSFGLDKLLGQQGIMITFIVISFVAVIFFGYFMFRNRGKDKLCRISFGLIIGGAIGNLVDRIAFSFVRDFIQFEYFGLTIFGSKSFAIFNIADAALCIGVVLFAVYYIFMYKEPKKVEKQSKSQIEYSALDDDEVVPNDSNVNHAKTIMTDQANVEYQTIVTGKSDASTADDNTDRSNKDGKDI